MTAPLTYTVPGTAFGGRPPRGRQHPIHLPVQVRHIHGCTHAVRQQAAAHLRLPEEQR
jgi:hypothetical protein